LTALSRTVVKGIGIEIDPREIQFARNRGLDVVEGFIDPFNPDERLNKIIEQADVVSMLNVLEHIEHPDAVINYYAEHMKTGACLVVEVPHHPSAASFVNLTSPDFTYRHIVPPIHLQVFSDKAIELMAGKSFRLIGTWGFGQGFTDMLTSAAIGSGGKESPLYQLLMNISNDVQRVIDKNGFADQMLYVLRKEG